VLRHYTAVKREFIITEPEKQIPKGNDRKKGSGKDQGNGKDKDSGKDKDNGNKSKRS